MKASSLPHLIGTCQPQYYLQPSVDNAAVELPKGYYVVMRRVRTSYSIAEALADIRACNPGRIVGRAVHNRTHWCWQVQTRDLPTQVRR